MKISSSDLSSPDSAHPSISEGLAKLALALYQRSWRDARTLGLSPTQVQSLVVLQRSGAQPVTLSALARELGLSSATVSDAVRVLELKGLVCKERSSEQANMLALSLTLTGQEVAARSSRWPKSLDEAVEALPPEEQRALVRGLGQIIHHLEETGDLVMARLCTTCQNFSPYHYPDPLRPHHCHLLNAPLGETQLRLDCDEHSAVLPEHQLTAREQWLAVERRR